MSSQAVLKDPLAAAGPVRPVWWGGELRVLTEILFLGLKCEVSDNEMKRKIKRLDAYGYSMSSKGPGVFICQNFMGEEFKLITLINKIHFPGKICRALN